MVVLDGISVCGKIGIGKLAFYKSEDNQVKDRYAENVLKEVKRFEEAKVVAIEELQGFYEKAMIRAQKDIAEIFKAHQVLLEDTEYVETIRHNIMNQRMIAEYAVSMVTEEFAKRFEMIDDAYIRERAADVKDVAKLVLNILTGTKRTELLFSEPTILVADDLTPSEMVQLDKNKVLGLAFQRGSAHSHTAILARSMEIPMIIGLGDVFRKEYDGLLAIVDGFEGKIYVNPDEKMLEDMKKKQEEEKMKHVLFTKLHGQEDKTVNGQKISVCANMNSMADLEAILQSQAAGIGLFRSEFLYLESNAFPTEEQQFQVYKKVAESMNGKKVIIRTVDIGADKQAEYFPLGQEANPALGYRGIRICLAQPEIFKTQLRAIYRASAYGRVAVMFPLITSIKEVKQIKIILEDVKAQLRTENIPFDENMEVGIMLETPAAIMVSRELAQEVDFFSVGTNDLTQYTLAIDRQNAKLQEFYDAHHPAILSMIQMAVDSAHAEGKRIGICGELGADLEMTEVLVKMGIDELSVVPSMVLSVRGRIREIE